MGLHSPKESMQLEIQKERWDIGGLYRAQAAPALDSKTPHQDRGQNRLCSQPSLHDVALVLYIMRSMTDRHPDDMVNCP